MRIERIERNEDCVPVVYDIFSRYSDNYQHGDKGILKVDLSSCGHKSKVSSNLAEPQSLFAVTKDPMAVHV